MFLRCFSNRGLAGGVVWRVKWRVSNSNTGRAKRFFFFLPFFFRDAFGCVV